MASNGFDMGSDHRVVKIYLRVFKLGRPRKRYLLKSKGWRPKKETNGVPQTYQAFIAEKMPGTGAKLEDLEQILYSAANSPGKRQEVRDRCKPCESDEIKVLTHQRRQCVTQADRRMVSK